MVIKILNIQAVSQSMEFGKTIIGSRSVQWLQYLYISSQTSVSSLLASDSGRLAVGFVAVCICISSFIIYNLCIHTLQSSNPRFIQLSASSFLGGRLLVLLFAFL